MWSIFSSPKVPKGPKQLYDYRLGRRFDPGAMAEVFEPLTTNPVYFFRGNGRVAGQFRTIQPPQVYVNRNAGVQGLGGIQAGQVFGQPLIDPSQTEPSAPI